MVGAGFGSCDRLLHFGKALSPPVFVAHSSMSAVCMASTARRVEVSVELFNETNCMLSSIDCAGSVNGL